MNTAVEPLPYWKLWHRKFESYWPVYMIDGTIINNRRNNKVNLGLIRSESKQTLLLPEILDYISHLLRLVTFEKDPFSAQRFENLGYIATQDMTFFRIIDIRRIVVERHGVEKVESWVDRKDIKYRNPYLSGDLSYHPIPESYRRSERLAISNLESIGTL